MCGIVGFITNESKKGETDRARFLKQGLIIDTLRGDDSTGVFGVGHEPLFDDGTAYWFKQLGGGEGFTDAKEYWENFADVSPYRAVVGHNRAATMGSVDTKSAHPFQEGPITLVHNGTLTSTFSLPKSLGMLKDVQVDSHAICHNLVEHDVEEVVRSLQGAFALVWHDARDNSVNIIRNDKRPLHFGMDKAGDTLYFMSEGEMLALLDRRIKLGIGSIYYPGEGVYLKWLPDTPLDRPITKELELYEDNYWSRFNTTGANSKYGGYSVSYGDWDDDEEEVYPKATAHPERDDWIMVGGRKKAVPMLIQETIMEYDVVVEDRWEFSILSYGLNPQDTDRMYVTGDVKGLGKGIIYSISPDTVNRTGTGKTNWTVRIIGVKVDAQGEPWFICRLVSTFVLLAAISLNDVVRTTRKEDTPGWDDDIPFNDHDGFVPGPGGVRISEHDFFHEVADGCVMCQKPIGIRDAFDLIWVSEGAICPNCDDRLYVSPKLTGGSNEDIY
jgi:hypothetical protein